MGPLGYRVCLSWVWHPVKVLIGLAQWSNVCACGNVVLAKGLALRLAESSSLTGVTKKKPKGLHDGVLKA